MKYLKDQIQAANDKLDAEVERIYESNPKMNSHTAMLMNLSVKDRRFMVINWWDAQVRNGGIVQWLDNGYGNTSNFLFDALQNIGGQHATMVQKMLEKAMGSDLDAVLEYDGPEYEELSRLDEAYYKIQDQFIVDLVNWLERD